MVPSVPDSFVRMLDGDTVTHRRPRLALHQRLRPRARAHRAVLRRAASVLLGGDMMLPRISTNVSVHAGEPEANSLRLFLDSIERFKALPADTLGLPSHGKPFTGIHRRVEQLQEHHRDRLAELLEACTGAPASPRPRACRSCSSARSTCTR